MKIQPNKYTNPDLTVIGLSVLIMDILTKSETVRYDHLFSKVMRKRGNFAKKNYSLALTFLYALGKIRYDQYTDMVILSK